MKRLCIFATPGGQAEQARGRYVVFALQKLREVVDRLIVVTDIQPGHPNFAQIDGLADAILPSPGGAMRSSFEGYRSGFGAISPDELAAYDEIVFADSSCYGPVYPLRPIVEDRHRRNLDFWSVGFSAKKRGIDTYKKIQLDRVLSPNLFSVSQAVASSQPFRQFMKGRRDFWNVSRWQLDEEHDLHLALHRAGLKWDSFLDPGMVRTAEPMLYEAAELVRAGYPFISAGLFSLDPLEADIRAINSPAVLDALRESGSDFDGAMIWESILPYYPLRLIQTNMDDLRVIDSSAGEPAKREWNFGGKIAVIAHIFYVDTLPEFLDLAANIPSDFDFFISTASDEAKRQIEAGIASFSCGGRKEVRVVEKNRGRDMSSLFITFRDVVLGGQYAWVLRLHSKRTPQVSWQIGQSFKQHLLDNLIPSRGFVTRLFSLLEKPEYRNVGILAPPVVQIGFGTLGHAWYSNREPLEKLAAQMHINVPLDHRTPVAVYGTMYWFRPQALAPMFQFDWKWDDYNAEPDHTDGGLAHVQERLICYCAQQQGFRTLAIMSPEQAARNYLKLEYKHQALAGCFPVRDVRHQYKLATRANWNRALGIYPRFLRFLENFDEWLRRTAPGLWRRSRAAVQVIWPMLKRFER